MTTNAASGTPNDLFAVDTGEIRLTLRAVPGKPLEAVSLEQSGGQRWYLAGTPPFSLEIDGEDVSGNLVVRDVYQGASTGTSTLQVHLRGKDGLSVTAFYDAVDGQGLVRTRLEVSSDQDVTITSVSAFRLTETAPTLARLHTVSGVQQQGGWRPQDGTYRSFRLEEHVLTADAPVVIESGLRSTWNETPWGALTGQAINGGVLVALDYGAQWKLEASAGAVSLSPTGVVTTLSAGESWSSPATWIGAFAGNLDDAAAVMHRYLRDLVIPATDDDFPWVQYNTWFSYYCELDAKTLLREADIAAETGVEVFYVDAGWWVGNPQRRDRFSSGLGNWTENRDKFPEGLKAFADAIRERGMHFGIWVEPERVDMRTATTGTWKPDWIAREADGTYVRCPWPSDTNTAWLCFGNPDVQAWATEWIGDLVADLDVRWLKWDSNYWDVCHSTEHGHQVGDAEAAQVEGVAMVMQNLRERFPDLMIENCAGGATRMDFALAAQTPAAWLNDASEPAHRSRFHNYGATYLFPPEMLNAWVTESEYENVNGQDLPDDVWRMTIRSRMLGAMGFSCRMTTWSDRTREIAGEEVRRYQHELRPLLKRGAFRHLLPQPEIPNLDLPTPDVWEAYQISAPDNSVLIVLGFRNVSPFETQVVSIRDVDATGTYEILAEHGHSRWMTGSDLLVNGLVLTAPLLASEWITVRRDS